MSHEDIGYALPLLNAFISTVDHLPCDLIRSLWFVQTSNTEAEKLHQKLREDEQNGTLDPQILNALRKRILRLEQEAIAETDSIRNQLLLQKHFLQTEKLQLERIKVTRTQQEIDRRLQLRETLEKHYAEHPLKSQVEALKEQQSREKDSQVKQEFTPSKNRKDEKTKLKLILKLPPRAPHPVKELKLNFTKDSNPETEKKRPKVKSISKPIPPPPVIPQKEVILEPEYESPEDEELYCICRQPSFGNMIACDNKECQNGEWFHYKCVGLLNRVDALEYTKGRKRWYCSHACREVVAQKIQSNRNGHKRKKARHRW